jgi:REP element-mobilizing transposase RayT
MSTKRQIPDSDGVYFITFTCFKWLPLFEIINGYDIVYNWFDYLKGKGHYIIGYVIMPNHVHALIGFSSKTAINSIVGNGKRFMAYILVFKSGLNLAF